MSLAQDTGSAKRKLLLLVPNRDVSYFRGVEKLLGKHFSSIVVRTDKVRDATTLRMLALTTGANFVMTTDMETFRVAYVGLSGNQGDNVGTVIEVEGLKGKNFRMMLQVPLVWNYSVPHGEFLLNHFCEKLAKGSLFTKDKFTWQFLTPKDLDMVALKASQSFLCAVDIETHRDHKRITSVAYTFGFSMKVPQTGGKTRTEIRTETYVVAFNKENFPFCLTAMRVLNRTKCPKVMQNGQYDASYFLLFNAPMVNWIYDTYNMFHCLYPELPKDLAFMSAFFLDDYRYWKDESSSDLYMYNAKDTHNTFWLWLAMLHHSAQLGNTYSKKNYLLEFPLVFPCLHCAMDGFLVDQEMQQSLKADAEGKLAVLRTSLGTLFGLPELNAASPKQMLAVMHSLGHLKIKSTDEKTLIACSEVDALSDRVVQLVLEIRGLAKAVSTYFSIELMHGYLLYTLDPGGTDTGRMASKSSNFWCGAQIQNIPMYARGMVVAEDGWTFGAVDKAQSESYCTAYIAQDLNLLKVINESPDFHCTNASLMFGIPFEELFDVATHTKLNKAIRDLAKKVNHGANYNMGAFVLLTTMGTKNVIHAQQLLKLPDDWKPLRVCAYLLGRFDATYPRVRGDWQQELIAEVRNTGKLSMPYIGWTRRTFLRPSKNKPELNSLVSHKPQGLSVRLVNIALKRVWLELQLGKYKGKFRIKAQVHDEIVFMVHDSLDIETVCKEVADIMVIPLDILGRTMVIPSTYEFGKRWSDLKG